MKNYILLVEDNPLNREWLTDWLEGEGYQVVPAVTLQEAFDAVHREAPALVLLDVKLGAEDGLELARWLQRRPQPHTVPVIAVTAHAMVSEQEQILQSGCIECLSKPVDVKRLRACLDRWMPRLPADPFRRMTEPNPNLIPKEPGG